MFETLMPKINKYYINFNIYSCFFLLTQYITSYYRFTISINFMRKHEYFFVTCSKLHLGNNNRFLNVFKEKVP